MDVELWQAALPPLPTFGELHEQLSDTNTTLAEKEQQLSEKDQQLRRYAKRIAELENRLSNVSTWCRETRQRMEEFNTKQALWASAVTDGVAVARPPPPQAPRSLPEPPPSVSLAQTQHSPPPLVFPPEAQHPPPPLSPPPPTPPIVRFSILTFGLRTINLAGEYPNNNILARTLAANWPDVRADVFIDARLFNDLDQHGVGHGHTGMHREILTRIAWHPRFYTWWQQ